MAKRADLFDYLKAAFTWHWNLLGVGGGIAFGLLSGAPDVILPIVTAVEVAYLGLLSTHPKFRRAIDAKQADAVTSAQRDTQLKAILNVLSPDDLGRFERLRDRCNTVTQLGKQFRGPTQDSGRLDDMHVRSLERLLWMFLKLLYSKDALDRFLSATARDTLASEIESTRAAIDKAKADGRPEALIRSLEDKLATVEQRLKNYDASEENRELIHAELDRIEQKVAALSEMSLSTRDPASISDHVNGIADSVSATADAIKDLDVVPDIEFDAAPELLHEEA